MKCIILFTFVALCYSYPYGPGPGSGYGYSGLGSGRSVSINQDGSVTLTASNGKRYTISRGPQQNAAIVVSGYQRYNRNFWNQPSQADALADILAQYQGDANQFSYQQFLDEIRSAAQAGQVGNNVYQALQNLNQAQNQGGQNQGKNNAQANQEAQQAQQIQQLIQQEQQVQQLLQQQQAQNQRLLQQNQGPIGLQGSQAGVYLRIAGNQGALGQRIGGGGAGAGRAWGLLIADLLNAQNAGQYGQYNQYGQQIGQSVANQVSQIAEEEQ